MPGPDQIKQMQEQLGKKQRELLDRLIADVTAHQREDLEILVPNEEGRFVLHRDPSPLFKKRGPGVTVQYSKATTYPTDTPVPEKNGEN